MMDYHYCPYCGPFQRCQQPDECWVEQEKDTAEEGDE